jgi:hypothetical protein
MKVNLTRCVNYPGMIWGIADEAHSLSYVTNRQTAKRPGETRSYKGYFYTAPNVVFGLFYLCF